MQIFLAVFLDASPFMLYNLYNNYLCPPADSVKFTAAIRRDFLINDTLREGFL